MGDKPLQTIIGDFSGGIVQAYNPLLLRPGVATDIDRLSLRKAPVLASERGRTALVSDPANIGTFLGQLRLSDSGRYQLLRGLGSAGSIQLWDGAAFNQIGTMTPGVPIEGALMEAAGKLILCDGVGPKTWDGDTFANLGGSAPLTLCRPCIHLNMFWGVESRTKLSHSVGGDPTDFTTEDRAGYVVIDNPEGSDITALLSYSGSTRLLVWTERAMRQVFGTAEGSFTVHPVDLSVGCINHLSMVQIGQTVYFVAPGNPGAIMEYAAGSVPRSVSRGSLDHLMPLVDFTKRDEFCATRGLDDEFRCILPKTDGTYDEVVYWPALRRFTINKNVQYRRYLLWWRP